DEIQARRVEEQGAVPHGAGPPQGGGDRPRLLVELPVVEMPGLLLAVGQKGIGAAFRRQGGAEPQCFRQRGDARSFWGMERLGHSPVSFLETDGGLVNDNGNARRSRGRVSPRLASDR